MNPPAAPAAPGHGWFGRLFVALSIACAAAAASAQALNVVRDDTDEKLIACLSPAASELPPVVYPADALVLKKDATVRVRLTFTQPDASPAADVFFNSSSDQEFSAAVRRRVKDYRLPCLLKGSSPVLATQEFYFDPRDGRPVMWNALQPGMSAAAPNACTQQTTGTVDYPRRALDRDSTRSTFTRESQSGVVLVRMRATSEGPPNVSILSDAGSRVLAGAVTDYLRTTRVRCDRYPADILQAFTFHIEGDRQYAFKDMSLQLFAGLLGDLDQQKVRFDFSTMRCPFDVQFTLYQPYAQNDVGEVGEADPNRADFLAWLRDMKLQLPAEAAKHLLGAQTRVSVACGLLDLRE